MAKEIEKVFIRPANLVKDLFHPMGDLDRILQIEQQSYDDPWDLKTIEYFLKLPGSGSFVAEYDGEVVGFLLFEMQDTYLNLVSVAIDPKVRRRGFGTLLIKELKNSDLAGCNRVYCTVSDKNLSAHLFLSKFGFKAINTKKNFYSEGHDAYEFMYVIRKRKKRTSKKGEANE